MSNGGYGEIDASYDLTTIDKLENAKGPIKPAFYQQVLRNSKFVTPNGRCRIEPLHSVPHIFVLCEIGVSAFVELHIGFTSPHEATVTLLQGSNSAMCIPIVSHV